VNKKKVPIHAERLAASLPADGQYRLLIDAVTDYAIYMLDSAGLVSSWNTGAHRFKGYEPLEIIGQHFSRFYTEEDRQAGLPAMALETASREGRFEGEGWRVRKDGTRFWANVVVDPIRASDGAIIGFAKITRDVTERMEAQKAAEISREALFHSQKMDAVGQLTGGIAHDFNNILGEITISLDLIQRQLDSGRSDGLDRLTKAASESAQRAAMLTHRLLAFARRQPLDVKAADTNALVASMENLFRRTLGENIALEVAVKAGTWPVLTDASQLENAILNLVINARDAMPDGGTLTIETVNTHLDEAYARLYVDVRAGDYVLISVSDTGKGMSDAIVNQAFDPFFTTKPIGQGTGLGLSMIHGFVKQSGGHVRIYSEVGRGTVVKIYLRRAIMDAEQTAPVPRDEVPGDQSKTILIVDDNHALLEAMKEAITELGYNCIAAPDAQSAITILNSPQRVDLLVTDVGLPIMNGRQLAEIAQQLRKDLRVLFMTGYTAKAAVRGNFLADGMEMMTKPFTINALADKLIQLTNDA